MRPFQTEPLPLAPGKSLSTPRESACPARLNPFAVSHTDNLAFRFSPVVTDSRGSWERPLQQLAQLRYRGVICGPHGSGKTTLLDQLGTQLQLRGRKSWRTRPPLNRLEHPAFLESCLRHSPDTILLVDSGEQLSRWNWWQLVRQSARRNQGLIATVHRPSRLLPAWVRTATTPELFLELLTELVPEIDAAARATALAAYRRHRGNIRDAFRELYDLVAQQKL